MARRWLAYTASGCEGEMRRAIASIGSTDSINFMRSASELREALRNEEPRSCCVAVGLSDEGVSDVNAAAALVADGLAGEVALVVRGVSGSLRSRSSAAGITRVIDVEAIDLDEPVFDDAGQNEETSGSFEDSSETSPDAKGSASSKVLGFGDGFPETEKLGSSAAVAASHLVAARCSRGNGLAADGRAPVVTFASGRGGVGKTTLIAAAAITASGWGLRVALVDFDLCCGNLRGAFGGGKRSDLSTLTRSGVGDAAQLKACGASCSDNIMLWGPVERPETAEIVMPFAGELIDRLAESFDLVLIDTSSTCTDAVAQAMQSADRVVMVHDDRPGAIMALSRMSALAVRLGVARTQIVRVDNRCPARLWGQAFLPRAELGLETARAYRVLEGGPEVSELCAEGKVSELMELDGDYARSVSAFVGALLEELGRLPDLEEARAAVEGAGLRKKTLFFARRKEAV